MRVKGYMNAITPEVVENVNLTDETKALLAKEPKYQCRI